MLPWLGLAARAALAAGIVAAAGWALTAAYRAGHDRAQLEARELADAAAQQARELARERARATGRIDHDTHQALRAAQAHADAAAADARGLRDALASATAAAPGASQPAGCADVRQQRDRLAGLLAEGAELVAACAAAGDRVAATATGLQRYVTEVSGVSVSTK
jgi:hypothetical protein